MIDDTLVKLFAILVLVGDGEQVFEHDIVHLE